VADDAYRRPADNLQRILIHRAPPSRTQWGGAGVLAGAEKPATRRQRPVGGMFEVLSARLIVFIFFAARFSLNVLPCFFW
jgi:hypothetical protein